MARYARDTVITAATEGTYGTDATPTPADDAILIGEHTHRLITNNVARDRLRPWFGASEELVGTFYQSDAFDVEFVGSGTAGDEPAWGKLLRGCAMDVTVDAGVRVDYLPVTTAQESVTLYSYPAGVLNKSLGSRGKVTLGMKQGEIPKLRFEFMGRHGGASVAAPAGTDLSAWRTPQVVTDANSVVMTLGGTVNDTGAPVITGGTAYPSLGLELDWGNDTPMTALVGGETVDVTARRLTGKITLDLTPTQEVAFEAVVLGNTLTTLAFQHGTVAGDRVMVFLPYVQLTNPQATDLNGRMLMTYDLVCPPGLATGNDEVRIIASF